MVRCNSIEASTRSSMAEFDDSELFRSSEFQENSDQADLKFLSGENYRLVPTTSKLLEKFDSMEAKMDVNFTEIQHTLSQLCNQLGIHPIDAEFTQHVPPVTNFSDPYVPDDVNRLSLDNRKNLSHKIEMPKFDGSNAYKWLSKVERFFCVGRYSDFDKLDLVSLSLEGDALKWFNWQLIRREFRSWEDFRRRLFRKFGAAPEKFSQNVAEILEERVSYTEKKGTVSTSVTESAELGTVSASVTESAELSSQVIGLDKSHLEELFSTGLQTEMQEVLKLKESMGLENNKHAVIRMETGSFCQLFSAATSKPWGNQQIVTSKPAASVHSLSFEVGTEETMSSGLSQNRQVWEPGGVLADHVLMDWLMDFNGYDGIVDGIQCLDIGVCSGITQPIDSRRASRVWERGGLDISTELLLHSDFETEVDIDKLQRPPMDTIAESVTTAPGWHEACDAEIDALEGTGTWIVTSLPANKISIGCTWVFKVKLNADESLERFKARLVAKGYTNREGVAFIDTFSPVTKLTTGYASRKGDWPENAVLHLKTSIYGLTQASRQWYLNFSTTLMALGFTKSFADQMFLRQQTSSSIWHRWRRKHWDLEVQLRERDLMFFQVQHNTSSTQQNSWMFSKCIPRIMSTPPFNSGFTIAVGVPAYAVAGSILSRLRTSDISMGGVLIRLVTWQAN